MTKKKEINSKKKEFFFFKKKKKAKIHLSNVGEERKQGTLYG
jgi:hypothetical protein